MAIAFVQDDFEFMKIIAGDNDQIFLSKIQMIGTQTSCGWSECNDHKFEWAETGTVLPYPGDPDWFPTWFGTHYGMYVDPGTNKDNWKCTLYYHGVGFL